MLSRGIDASHLQSTGLFRVQFLGRSSVVAEDAPIAAQGLPPTVADHTRPGDSPCSSRCGSCHLLATESERDAGHRRFARCRGVRRFPAVPTIKTPSPRMAPGMIGADGSTTGGPPHDLPVALAERPSPRIADPLSLIVLVAPAARAQAVAPLRWPDTGRALKVGVTTLELDIDFTHKGGGWTGDITIPARGQGPAAPGYLGRGRPGRLQDGRRARRSLLQGDALGRRLDDQGDLHASRQVAGALLCHAADPSPS